MFIELTGMVGAGKSTLAAELKRLLQARQLKPLSPIEAMARCLERSPLGRALSRLTPAAWRGQLMSSVYIPAIELLYRLLFAIEHPALAWHVVASQLRRELPWWHRRIIIHLFFEVAGQYQFLRRRLRPSEVVVLEEGLVHRAINLYAWETRPLDRAKVTAYFRRLPPCDLTLVIQAPLDVCLARARARGLPRRLSCKDERTIELFMRNSAQIIAAASKFLADNRRPAAEIDNSGGLEAGLRAMRRGLESRLDGKRAHARGLRRQIADAGEVPAQEAPPT